MSEKTLPQGYPNFAPGGTRHLLASIHNWARYTGWTWYEAWGWVSSNDLDHADFAVTWDTESRTITVRRNTGNGLFRPTTYPADTVRQAVDVLVTYGVLPARFSSAVERVVRLCDDYKDQPPPIFRGPGLSEHGVGYSRGTRDLAWAVLSLIAGDESDGGAR